MVINMKKTIKDTINYIDVEKGIVKGKFVKKELYEQKLNEVLEDMPNFLFKEHLLLNDIKYLQYGEVLKIKWMKI